MSIMDDGAIILSIAQYVSYTDKVNRLVALAYSSERSE
jgi:hypothetical protein